MAHGLLNQTPQAYYNVLQAGQGMDSSKIQNEKA